LLVERPNAVPRLRTKHGSHVYEPVRRE
jgi:hypothetical protein